MPPVLPGGFSTLDHQGNPKFSSRSFIVLGLLGFFFFFLHFFSFIFPLSVLLNISLGLC